MRHVLNAIFSVFVVISSSQIAKAESTWTPACQATVDKFGTLRDDIDRNVRDVGASWSKYASYCLNGLQLEPWCPLLKEFLASNKDGVAITLRSATAIGCSAEDTRLHINAKYDNPLLQIPNVQMFGYK